MHKQRQKNQFNSKHSEKFRENPFPQHILYFFQEDLCICCFLSPPPNMKLLLILIAIFVKYENNLSGSFKCWGAESSILTSFICSVGFSIFAIATGWCKHLIKQLYISLRHLINQLYSILKTNSSIAYSENLTNKLTETQPKNKTKPRVSFIEIRTWRLKEKKKFYCGFK